MSVSGEREGESFRSPAEQRERIEGAWEREGIAGVAIHEEIDVSGGAALEARHGLSEALRAIEAGEAEVLTVAYFDRLFRSLKVQDEVVSRVEAAGGRVQALDFGRVTGATAAQWLSSTMIGAMSEYYRRSVGERVAGAQSIAVAKGVWTSRIPVGYEQGADGVLVPDDRAPAVTRAFELRADGASIREVRLYLREQGIERTYASVEKMLRSRAYLGEIHFGAMVNVEAHEPLVPREVWKAAQRVRVPKGPLGKSARLLARLGVLRCGTCNARMIAAGRPKYPVYRCNHPDCPASPSIMAHKVESAVIEAVQRELADVEGRASAQGRASEAEAALEKAQANLDAGTRVLADFMDEYAAVEKLAELRGIRDEAADAVDQLGGLRAAAVIRADTDWELLTLDNRRALVVSTIERVTVAPGRGADRITIHPFSEDSPGL